MLKIERRRLPDYLNGIQTLWEEFKDNLRADKRTGIEDIVQQENPDPEFIRAVVEGLNKLQYISNEKTHSIMREYAAEVEKVLLADRTVVLIFETDDSDSSETYFAKMVQQMVSSDLKSRIIFSEDFYSQDIGQLINQKNFIVYRFDDSSNSGSQVISSIRSFIHLYSKYKKPFVFRTRLVASGQANLDDHLRGTVDSWLNKDGITDVNYTVDSDQKYLNKKIEVFYKGHRVTYGTSIVFGHKIQDNLPELFISLGESHRRDKPHFFKYDTDIKPPYKK